MQPEVDAVDLNVRLAARAMGRHGLAHAYGHVSARLDEERLRVCPPVPMITVAPGAPGVTVIIDQPLPDGVLPEVRMHQAIYRARPDVGGICRVQPPAVLALSALGKTPRVLSGLGAYFWPAPALWESTALVRDDASATAVAAALGDGAAIVLRGNGAVVVGPDIRTAAALAFFLEDAARTELAILPARAAGIQPLEYSAEEAAARAIRTGGLFERMWHFLCFGDPECRQDS